MQPGEITDRLFGTRAYTEGARFQIPRKIPLRIEPKTYFGEHSKQFQILAPKEFFFLPYTNSSIAANERTFLSWLSMAVTLGSVGTAIAGFAVEDEDSPGQHKGGISQSTVQLMTLTMLPISICMIAYALFTFYWRSEFIRKKQVCGDF